MSIQDLGSIADLIAALATIITLAYLAFQIRENTKAVRSESSRSIRSDGAATFRLIAADPGVAGLFNKGLSDPESLDPVELTRFNFLISEFYSLIECAHREWKLGVGQESDVQKLIRQCSGVFRTPGGRYWWKQQSAIHPLDIREYLEPILGDESNDDR
jgi:hypothetical protein